MPVAVITKNIIENNDTGVVITNSGSTLSCNRICNSNPYDLRYVAVSNFNATDNYWCTNDSTQIAAAIYDGYYNINYCLVTFLPTDSVCSPGTTGINEMTSAATGFQISPNPTTGLIQLTLPNFSKVSNFGKVYLEIMNVMGERVYESQLQAPPQPSPKGREFSAQIDVSGLAKGIYIVRVGDGVRWENRKLVVE